MERDCLPVWMENLFRQHKDVLVTKAGSAKVDDAFKAKLAASEYGDLIREAFKERKKQEKAIRDARRASKSD